MDIFKFNNPNEATKMEQGQLINGLKSKLWVERYDTAGEFKLIGNVSKGIRELLPIGTFISHIDTNEIMIVEDHEISDKKSKETEVIITGRSYDSFLEHRVTGVNIVQPDADPGYHENIPAGTPWDQLKTYIELNIDSDELDNPDNALPYVSVIADVTGSEYNPFAVWSKSVEELYPTVLDWLASYNMGLKVIRPGAYTHVGLTAGDTAFVIHRGVDRTADVIFSYDTGELESADYLWSNRNLKTSALVTGKWIRQIFHGPEVEYYRRILLLDVTHIDDRYETEPTGTDYDDLVDEAEQYALEVLNMYNGVTITKVEVSKSGGLYKYRQDYDLGDIITVAGDYNAVTAMRVIEYVESEDENGIKGYPTLSMD